MDGIAQLFRFEFVSHVDSVAQIECKTFSSDEITTFEVEGREFAHSKKKSEEAQEVSLIILNKYF